MPLSPAGRAFMGVVYFSVPVLVGIQVMEWAKGKAVTNLGPDAELLRGKRSMDTQEQNQALQLYLDEHKKNKSTQAK
jgi:hypothetical protein